MEHPNLSYIDKLSGSDKNFKAQLITILKNELPEEIEVYRYSLKNGNYLDIASHVHKLKHKISILGMEGSYKKAESFEEDLKSTGDLKLQKEFEAILSLMKDFVEKL